MKPHLFNSKRSHTVSGNWPTCTYACGKQNKAKYGERTEDEPIRSTHCSECAKPLGYALADVVLGSFVFEDSKKCSAQAKGVIKYVQDGDAVAFCSTYASGQGYERKNPCKEPGCKLSQVTGGFCTTHAKSHGLARSDNRVDCKKTRGTSKDGSELICRACKEKRQEQNPDVEIVSTNPMCEVCGAVRRGFAPTWHDQPRRCGACSGGLGWVCATNKKRGRDEIVAESSDEADVSISIPQYGDFFADMVPNIVIP